jgi:hypothetical protein
MSCNCSHYDVSKFGLGMVRTSQRVGSAVSETRRYLLCEGFTDLVPLQVLVLNAGLVVS